jgi:hypothetical protein
MGCPELERVEINIEEVDVDGPLLSRRGPQIQDPFKTENVPYLSDITSSRPLNAFENFETCYRVPIKVTSKLSKEMSQRTNRATIINPTVTPACVCADRSDVLVVDDNVFNIITL